jgi:hypothetical protein
MDFVICVCKNSKGSIKERNKRNRNSYLIVVAVVKEKENN